MFDMAIAAAIGSAVHVAAHLASGKYVGFEAFDSFKRTEAEGNVVLERVVDAGIPWTELVPSWNATAPSGSEVVVEVQALRELGATKFYSFGTWGLGARQSLPGQKDADGDVLTDTLRMIAPCQSVLVRVTLRGEANLKFLGLCFANTALEPNQSEPIREAWGKVLDVPARAQMSYPNGPKICSPTCVSMILSYWSHRLGRPDLDREVPEVCAAVDDPNWPGTGNWPFNTAYAGSFEGVRAYVARFSDVSQLEAWIAAGVPVATSVAYDILRFGERKRASDGHLMVLVGFTKEGDPVFNDPASTEQVRRVYPRDSFVKAWAESKRTVYLVYPVGHPVPEDHFGKWFTPPSP